MTKKYRIALLGILAMVVVGVAYWMSHRSTTTAPGMAALPPAQTLGFTALPGLPQAWADLRQTKFFRQVSSPAFWQVALGPEGYRRLITEKHLLEQRLGFPLTEQTVSTLLGRELGVALVPSRTGAWPVDVIAYLRMSGTERLLEGLTQTLTVAMPNLVRETQTVDGTEIVTLHPKGVPNSLSYAFVGNLTVLATDPAWVVDAVKAGRGTAGTRLAALPAMRALRVEKAEALLAYGYYDIAGMQARLATWLPSGAPSPTGTTRPMPQSTSQFTLKALRSSGGVRLETMALYPGNSMPPFLRRPERDGTTSALRGVPAETFYLAHIDILDVQGIWQWLKHMGAAAGEGEIAQVIAQFREATGVDLEQDVLPALTGAIGLGVTAPFGPQASSPLPLPGLFLTLGITDESRVDQLLQTIGDHVGGAGFRELLQHLPYDGHEIHYLRHPLVFIKPGYVIGQRQLILGSDISLLQHMLDAAAGRTKTLADARLYQDWRKHVHLQGGTVSFLDVATALEKAMELRTRLGFLVQLLAQLNPEQSPPGLTQVDPWAFLELLRPVHYVGSVSQAEAQGVRTEGFVALEDLR